MKLSRLAFLFLFLFLLFPLVSYGQHRTRRGNSTLTFSFITKNFEGYLGEPINVGITMRLNRNGRSLSGTVLDKSTKKTTKVKGVISANGGIKLYEYDRKGKQIGLWKGRLNSEESQFSGSYWSTRDGEGADFVLTAPILPY